MFYDTRLDCVFAVDETEIYCGETPQACLAAGALARWLRSLGKQVPQIYVVNRMPTIVEVANCTVVIDVPLNPKHPAAINVEWLKAHCRKVLTAIVPEIQAQQYLEGLGQDRVITGATTSISNLLVSLGLEVPAWIVSASDHCTDPLLAPESSEGKTIIRAWANAMVANDYVLTQLEQALIMAAWGCEPTDSARQALCDSAWHIVCGMADRVLDESASGMLFQVSSGRCPR